MGTRTQELKYEARLQEWSVRIQECRTSGMGVKARCATQEIALKTYYNWERQIRKSSNAKHDITGSNAKRNIRVCF